MAVIYTNCEPKPGRGHSKALPRVDLNLPGWLYIGHLESYYNVSHSSVYSYIEKGLIPSADSRIGRRQVWKTSTIKAALEK